MRTYRIAVPPGVGDVYWCLTKLGDFRKKNRIDHVTLCVKKSPLTRALEWSEMTDLVDATEELKFQPSKKLKNRGHSMDIPGADYAMWPNAVVDRGFHLENWMPNYQIDFNFKIKTKDPLFDPGIVVYASSNGVNKNWFETGGPEFWSGVLKELADKTGKVATLIGAEWDRDMFDQLDAPFFPMIGKTNLPEVAGILKKAKVVVGIISGMTILANHFRTPVVTIYPDHMFPVTFPNSWIAKDYNRYTFFPSSFIKSSEQLTRAALEICKK